MSLTRAAWLRLALAAALMSMGASDTTTVSSTDTTTTSAATTTTAAAAATTTTTTAADTTTKQTTTQQQQQQAQVTTELLSTEPNTTQAEPTTSQTTTTQAGSSKGNLETTTRLALILLGALVGGVPIFCLLYCGIKAAVQSYRDKRKVQTDSQRPPHHGKPQFISNMKPRKTISNGTKYPKWQT